MNRTPAPSQEEFSALNNQDQKTTSPSVVNKTKVVSVKTNTGVVQAAVIQTKEGIVHNINEAWVRDHKSKRK